MRIIVSFIILIFYFSSADAQIKLKLADKKENQSSFNSLKLPDKAYKGGLPLFIYAGLGFFLINPEIVIENKKAYFGLTKEISTGYYPFGRIAFEYTHIFRSYSQNHLRLSYNLDY